MRATILPNAIILTKACGIAVNVMALGGIVTWLLPLKCFLFLLANYITFPAIIMHY